MAWLRLKAQRLFTNDQLVKRFAGDTPRFPYLFSFFPLPGMGCLLLLKKERCDLCWLWLFLWVFVSYFFWVHPSSFASTQAKSHAWRHMKLVAVGVCVNWFNVDIHPLQKISPQFLCILTVQGNNNISEAIFLFKVHKGYERWRFSAFSNLELSFCLFWTQNRKQSNLKCGHLAPPAKFNSSTIQQQFNNCNTTAPFLKWPILQDPPRKHHHFEEYTNHTRSPGECFPPFFWFW